MLFRKCLSVKALVVRAMAGGLVVAAAAKGFAKDDVKYGKIVELLTLKAAPAKDNPKLTTIEIVFNLSPDLPKDVKMEFELEYQSEELEKAYFQLKDENRKNLKLSFTPKTRLAVDEYFLRTRVRLDQQAEAVKEAILKKEKVFPPDQEPWPMYYPDKPIKVGSKKDKEAEDQEVKEYFQRSCDALMELSNEFMEAMEAMDKGEKFVSEKKIDQKPLVDFILGWMKKMGEQQAALENYAKAEPALVRKRPVAYGYLGELGRMIAKRCYRDTLPKILAKYGSNLANLKITADKNFISSYRFRVRPVDLENKYKEIARLTGFGEEGEEGEEEPEGPKPGEGEGAGKDEKNQ
ncbi:MAG: hypothetical protein HY717_20945 [Planctomycetes bacterium]|nr:hypothetical protein [Planctomycetota bacterium]